METETCFTCDCEQGRFCHDIDAGYAIETCNPLRLCGASASNHEVGARNAIESFLTKQALEVLRGPLVTILARYMRLTSFQRAFPSAASHVIGSLAPDIVEKTFNRISRANIVTSATRNISKRWSTSKNFNRISRANMHD